jgi:hypothetical protein
MKTCSLHVLVELCVKHLFWDRATCCDNQSAIVFTLNPNYIGTKHIEMYYPFVNEKVAPSQNP